MGENIMEGKSVLAIQNFKEYILQEFKAFLVYKSSKKLLLH